LNDVRLRQHAHRHHRARRIAHIDVEDVVDLLSKRRVGLDAQGKSILESAAIGARLRFRPVMMTSFAFIFGLLPLVIAVGAGAITRRAVGTPVFGGVLAASVFGIFIIPML